MSDDAICIVDKCAGPGNLGLVGLSSHIRTPKNRGLSLGKVQLQYMKPEINSYYLVLLLLLLS